MHWDRIKQGIRYCTEKEKTTRHTLLNWDRKTRHTLLHWERKKQDIRYWTKIEKTRHTLLHWERKNNKTYVTALRKEHKTYVTEQR